MTQSSRSFIAYLLLVDIDVINTSISLRHHHITYASSSLPLKAQVNNKLELPKLKSDKQLCKLLFKSNLNIFVAVVGNVIVIVVVNYCTVPNFRACNYCCVCMFIY